MNEPEEDGSSIASKKKKTLLSKSALYAPLAAYQQTELEPSEYANNQSKIPKSIMESTLTSFLRSVSHTYHRKRARSYDPKNNGSRPQSLLDVDGSIRQKAVTLLGGVGGTSTTTIAATISTNEQQRRKNKRRRRRRKSFDEIKQYIVNDPSSLKDDGDNSLRQNEIHFLKELNESWNEYITDIIQFNINSDDDYDDDVMISKAKRIFSEDRSKLELIGAQIRISSCNQKKNLVGMFGILVGESKNTWKAHRIQPPIPGCQMVSIKNLDDDANNNGSYNDTNISPSSKSNNIEDGKSRLLPKNSASKKQQQTAFIVPKRGSIIDLLIPISPHLNRLEQGDTGQTIEQLSSKYVTITINPNNNY